MFNAEIAVKRTNKSYDRLVKREARRLHRLIKQRIKEGCYYLETYCKALRGIIDELLKDGYYANYERISSDIYKIRIRW